MTAPPPGRMPRIDPMIVPRTMAGAESIRSFLVGINPVTFSCTSSRSISAPASRLRMISANPNTPIATVAKPRPSASSGMLNAMREAPVSMSEPTIDSSSPNTIIAMALSTDTFASTTAKIRPSTISEKYSAGPNASASFVKGAPSTAISTVATQPAKNDPIAAIAGAGQHPDQRTDERADQAKQKIDRRKGDAETEGKIGKEFGHYALTEPGNA